MKNNKNKKRTHINSGRQRFVKENKFKDYHNIKFSSSAIHISAHINIAGTCVWEKTKNDYKPDGKTENQQQT